MTDKKFCRKAFSLILLLLPFLFFAQNKTAEANYYIGIVGIESRVNTINLGDYTNLDDLNKHPLVYAQDVFEDILTTDLPTLGLTGVDKTSYAKMARQSEAEFQRVQAQLKKSISQLDKGDTSEAVKLFDKKLDYLIYGYIANMTITHRESIASSNISVRVDLTTRIVDASTGKVVCVAIGKGESSSRGGGSRKSFKFGGEEISEECWHEALEKALGQIVERIKKQI